MAGLQAAIDGTLQERSAGLSADDVTSIDVTVSHAVYHHGWWRGKLDDDRIWRLTDCTDVHLNADFETPAGPGRYTTDLAFTTRSGGHRERRVLTPPGGPDRPLTNAAILAKFTALTGGVMSARRSAKIRLLVLGLGEDRPIDELISVLASEVRPML